MYTRQRRLAVVLTAASAAVLTMVACRPSPAAAPSTSAQAPAAASLIGAPSPSAGNSAAAGSAAPPVRYGTFEHPFVKTSFWYSPVGTGARWKKPAKLEADAFGFDAVYFVRVKPDDPVVNTYLWGDWVQKRCSGTTAQPQLRWHPEVGTIRFPSGFVLADTNPRPGPGYSTPNNKLAALRADGRTIDEFGAACRDTKGGPLYGYRAPSYDLTKAASQTSGICHGGSLLPCLGGTIRAGELTGAGDIEHVLGMNIGGDYMYYDKAAQTGARWPANGTGDGCAASCYKGTDPALQMGSLLALPKSVNLDALGLTTEPGRKIGKALQEYGALVVDNTGLRSADFNIDATEIAAADRQYGGGRPLREQSAFQRDLHKLFDALHVVTNNAPGTPGGGS